MIKAMGISKANSEANSNESIGSSGRFDPHGRSKQYFFDAQAGNAENKTSEDWLKVLESMTADFNNDNYKVFFPLSPRPWTEPVVHAYSSVSPNFILSHVLQSGSQACPPDATSLIPNTGLLIEAGCMTKIAEVERAVRVAEAEVYRLRAKEYVLKAHLFKIQASIRDRLLQISDNLIGHTRAELERIAESQVPNLKQAFNSAIGTSA